MNSEGLGLRVGVLGCRGPELGHPQGDEVTVQGLGS
jgi:hypothetical protein